MAWCATARGAPAPAVPSALLESPVNTPLGELDALGDQLGEARWQYISFGGGPRSCLGDHFAMLEATLALATIIRAVEISSLPGIYALSHQGVGQRCLTYRLIPRTPRSISQLGLRCRQSA